MVPRPAITTEPPQGRDDEKAVHGALIRHRPMLSTLVNPTDGHRFDGDAEASPLAALIFSIAARTAGRS